LSVISCRCSAKVLVLCLVARAGTFSQTKGSSSLPVGLLTPRRGISLAFSAVRFRCAADILVSSPVAVAYTARAGVLRLPKVPPSIPAQRRTQRQGVSLTAHETKADCISNSLCHRRAQSRPAPSAVCD
jgi:hypothetical protein